MIITPEQEEEFLKATNCHICNKKLRKRNGKIVKVRDHCHITGNYRGAAHRKCNLNFRLSNKIPIVFHNLKGYDGKFILQELGRISDKIKKTINVIPNNEEIYMAFMIDNLRFIDSYQFLNDSLSALAPNLKDHPYTEKYCKENNMDYKLMKEKGIYPYEYMHSFSRFKEDKLPSKGDFYSSLNDSSITDDEYKRANKVFNLYCNNLGDYHDLYLKTEVLLLSDIFENYRNECFKNYNLDPTHYYSSPDWLGTLC